METVIIVIHLMVVLALVGVVLLQRSEGGGLGIGGGSGFMTARGASNALTRATAILAAVFFVTSLGLSIYARYGERPTDVLDLVPTTSGEQGEGSGGVLDQLGGSATPSAPVPAEPVAPAPAEPVQVQPLAPDAPAGEAAPTPLGTEQQPQVPTGQ
jgi:preprotein translocase subunit SecG